ncbi:MAG: 50S ribosomal protein L25 [Rickettsia sp.]|nr:50S ribosomal protein L25 [Rickettsia sp.]
MKDISQNPIKIEAFLRSGSEFNTAKKLRSSNFIPAIIYGKNQKNLSIFFDVKSLQTISQNRDFFTEKIELNIQKKTYLVFPKKLERHPVNEKILHMDFMFFNKNEQKLEVPIIYDKAQDLTTVKQGGYFNIIRRNIAVLCSQDNYVKSILLDLPSMRKFRVLRILDIKKKFPDIKILENENIVIASIVSKKNITEEEEKIEKTVDSTAQKE